MGKRTKKLLSKLRKKPARRLSSTTDDSPSPKPKALKRTKVGREEVQPNPLDKLWQSSSTLSTEDGVVVKCPARFTNLFKAEESPGTASGSSNSEKESGTESAEPKVVVMDTGIRKQDRDERRRSKKRLTFGTEVEHIPYQNTSMDANADAFTTPTDFSFSGTDSGISPEDRRAHFWRSVIADRPMMKRPSQSQALFSGSAPEPKMKKHDNDSGVDLARNKMIQGCTEFETLLKEQRDCFLKKIKRYMAQVGQIDKTLSEVEKQREVFETGRSLSPIPRMVDSKLIAAPNFRVEPLL